MSLLRRKWMTVLLMKNNNNNKHTKITEHKRVHTHQIRTQARMYARTHARMHTHTHTRARARAHECTNAPFFCIVCIVQHSSFSVKKKKKKKKKGIRGWGWRRKWQYDLHVLMLQGPRRFVQCVKEIKGLNFIKAFFVCLLFRY